MFSATESPARLRLRIEIATPVVCGEEENRERREISSLPRGRLRRFPGLLPQLIERRNGLNYSIGQIQGCEVARKPTVCRRLSGIPICPSLVRRSKHRPLRSISPKVTRGPIPFSPLRHSLRVARSEATQKPPGYSPSRHRPLYWS